MLTNPSLSHKILTLLDKKQKLVKEIKTNGFSNETSINLCNTTDALENACKDLPFLVLNKIGKTIKKRKHHLFMSTIKPKPIDENELMSGYAIFSNDRWVPIETLTKEIPICDIIEHAGRTHPQFFTNQMR